MPPARVYRGVNIGEAMSINGSVTLPSPPLADPPNIPRRPPHSRQSSISSRSERSRAGSDVWRPAHSRQNSNNSSHSRQNSRGEDIHRPPLSANNPRDDILEIRDSGISSGNSKRHSKNISKSGRNITEAYSLLQGGADTIEYSTTKNFRYDQPISEKKTVPAWVGVPQYLDMDKKETWKRRTTDIIPMLFTIPFFVIAATIMLAHKKPVTPALFTRLNELTKIIATIFPLEFSITVGRAFIKYTNYKLEQGTTLGLLERLINSRTVLGTVRTQVRLGFVPLLSLSLIALWLVSPFGSQAAQRMFTTTLAPITSPTKTTYLNTRQPNYAGSALFETAWFPGFTSLISASLVAPESVKTGSMDLYGNVKIPFLSALANLPEDRNGWRNIPQEQFSITYSSLFGIATSQLPDGNSTFNLESTYIELTCGNLTSTVTRGADGFTNPGLIGGNGAFRSGQTITEDTNFAIGYLGADMTDLLSSSTADRNTSQCLDCLRNDFTSSTQIPGMLLYQDFTGTSNVVSIYCVPAQAYVESVVLCSKSPNTQTKCSVTAQRTSISSQSPSAITLLSFNNTLSGLTSLLPQSTRLLQGIDTIQNYLLSPLSNDFIQSTPTPRYIANQITSQTGGESKVTDVLMQDFSVRLSQLLNTFLQGSTPNATAYLTGTTLPNTPDISNTPESLTTAIKAKNQALTVPASLIKLTPIFLCIWSWAIVFLLSTCVLLFASIFAAYIRRKTLTRDFLPYAGNLILQSEFVDTPRGGVKMEGLERMKECKDMKVRLGDVGDGEGWEVGTGVRVGVGRVGVMSWDGREEGRLERGKLYL